MTDGAIKDRRPPLRLNRPDQPPKAPHQGVLLANLGVGSTGGVRPGAGDLHRHRTPSGTGRR